MEEEQRCALARRLATGSVDRELSNSKIMSFSMPPEAYNDVEKRKRVKEHERPRERLKFFPTVHVALLLYYFWAHTCYSLLACGWLETGHGCLVKRYYAIQRSATPTRPPDCQAFAASGVKPEITP